MSKKVQFLSISKEISILNKQIFKIETNSIDNTVRFRLENQ